MKRAILLLVLFLMLAGSVTAFPNEGFIHYTTSKINQSTVRVWNTTALTPAQTFPELAGDINWIDAAASPNRQEHVQVELHDGGTLVANVFRQSPYAAKVLTTNFGAIASNYKGFAVTYDQSGNAMIVYANDTEAAVYEIWNGTNFIGGGLLVQNDSCRGIPRWIDLAADPNSNEIIMVELDTTASHCAQTWNGTTWGSPNFFADTDLSSSAAPRIDIAYNNNSQALVVFESDSLGAPRFATWSGSWSGTSSVPGLTSDLISWVRLAPTTDRIALTTYSRSNSTATVGTWNGSWSPFTIVRSSILESASRPIDLAYQGNTLMLVYQDNETSSIQYATCSNFCESNAWSAPATLGTTYNNTYIQLASSTLSSDLLLGTLTFNQETYFSKYTSSWTAPTFLGNGTNTLNREDLALRLDNFNDTTPPIVLSIIPSAGSNLSAPLTVTVNASVYDDGVVDTVRAYIRSPSGLTNVFQLSNTSTVYTVTFLPSEIGIHNITIVANDTAGYVNNTETSWFNYSRGPPNVTILSPPASSSFSNGTSVTFIGNASDVSGNLLTGNSVYWTSSLDGNLGNGTTIARVLSVGVHTITFLAKDSMNLTANTSMLLQIFPDRDRDGLADNPDTLEGNESWVSTVGVDTLNILVDDNETIMGIGFLDLRNITFNDVNTTILELQHNFTIEEIDLSQFSIYITSTEFIISITNDNISQNPKTVYVNDVSITELCVKSAPATSGADITSTCNGANETNFDTCIGNSNVTINGITCTDLGNTIKLENLTYVSIETKLPVVQQGGGSRNNGGSNIGRRTNTEEPEETSDNPPPSPTPGSNTPAPQTATQTVSPKAPEKSPIIPEPTKEVHSESSWWPWILAIIGLLLVAISFLMRRGGLKEEKMTDSYFSK
ncbi:MAG: hypothetical protein ACE5FT_00425 [Candidatus Nanoarchaeia archaeon]